MVFHLVALADAFGSMEDPIRYPEVNAFGDRKCIGGMSTERSWRIIYASTSHVYARLPNPPLTSGILPSHNRFTRLVS